MTRPGALSPALRGPSVTTAAVRTAGGMAGPRVRLVSETGQLGTGLSPPVGDSRDRAVAGTPRPGLLLGPEQIWRPGRNPREAALGHGA